MYMFLQYAYNLYSIVSLIVSANQLAMCTCIIIAVLIYHDVIIQILILFYISCYLLSVRYSVNDM